MAKKKENPQPRKMTRRQISHHQKAQRRQRIIFISGLAVILAIVFIIAVGWLVGEYIPGHKTVVEVYDVSYDRDYYVDALEYAASAYPDYPVYYVSYDLLTQIEQRALLIHGAAELGITVSDEEVKEQLEIMEAESSPALVDIIRAQLLQEKLAEEYFGPQVSETGAQVTMEAFMVEDMAQAEKVRQLWLTSDIVTPIVQEYAVDIYAAYSDGLYDWHPAEIMEGYIGAAIPVEYAFGAEPGEISSPLADDESVKQVGYWVLKVIGHEEDGSVVAQGLLLGSEAEAEEMRDRLNAGEELAALAEEYSQDSASNTAGGELGVLTKPEEEDVYALTAATDAYLFADDTEIDVWSQPIRDTEASSKGGVWLVKVLDKDDARVLSDDDRDTLVNQALANWFNDLTTASEGSINELLTEEQQQFAIDEVTKRLSSG